LGVTILAIVKAVFGVGWNTERRTKAIALYIGAAAKWARIKFDVTHDQARHACRRSGQPKYEKAYDNRRTLSADVCTAQF
jgi:hypothetical protein